MNYGVYILTYKEDYKYCLATIFSVKKYNPQLPITLLVDGQFDLNEKALKQAQVSVINLQELKEPYQEDSFSGWGYGKILPFFYGPYERFAVLDADTVVVGSLMELLNSEAQFVSSTHIPLNIPSRRDETISECFFNPDFADNYFGSSWRLHIDNLFVSGFFVADKGLLDFQDYRRLRDIQAQNKDAIFPGDQGILNVWLLEKLMNKSFAVMVLDVQRIIYAFIKNECSDDIYFKHMQCIKRNLPVRETIIYHWAGNTKPYTFNKGTYWKMVYHFRKEFYIKYADYALVKSHYKIIKSDFYQSLRKLYSLFYRKKQ